MGLVVGIGGVSRAGKSSLARELASAFAGESMILSMDDFVKREADIPRIRDRIDWESPDSVDYDQLIHQTEELSEKYDLVIVEGILIYANPKLARLFDLALFLEISKEEFFKRKQADERWNEPEWFIEHIWESYVQYGREVPDQHQVIPGDEPFDTNSIISRLATLS